MSTYECWPGSKYISLMCFTVVNMLYNLSIFVFYFEEGHSKYIFKTKIFGKIRTNIDSNLVFILIQSIFL